MANHKRGEATVSLPTGRMGPDGKPEINVYTIRFNFNAVAELERISGVPVTHLSEQVGIGFIRDALSVGLRAASPANRKMTPAVVGDRMDPDQIEHYAEAVSSALASFFGATPELQKEQEDELGEAQQKHDKPPLETTANGTGAVSSENPPS